MCWCGVCYSDSLLVWKEEGWQHYQYQLAELTEQKRNDLDVIWMWYAEEVIDTPTTTSSNHKSMHNEAYIDAHAHAITKGR